MDTVWAIDGDKMKYRHQWKDRAGGNGFGLSDEEVMYTITVRDRHMVCMEIGSEDKAAEVKPCA